MSVSLSTVQRDTRSATPKACGVLLLFVAVQKASKTRSILISLSFVRRDWRIGVDPKHAIIAKARMDVNMEMRDFLKRCLPDRVPNAQAFVRRLATNDAYPPFLKARLREDAGRCRKRCR